MINTALEVLYCWSYLLTETKHCAASLQQQNFLSVSVCIYSFQHIKPIFLTTDLVTHSIYLFIVIKNNYYNITDQFTLVRWLLRCLASIADTVCGRPCNFTGSLVWSLGLTFEDVTSKVYRCCMWLTCLSSYQLWSFCSCPFVTYIPVHLPSVQHVDLAALTFDLRL